MLVSPSTWWNSKKYFPFDLLFGGNCPKINGVINRPISKKAFKRPRRCTTLFQATQLRKLELKAGVTDLKNCFSVRVSEHLSFRGSPTQYAEMQERNGRTESVPLGYQYGWVRVLMELVPEMKFFLVKYTRGHDQPLP